MAEKRKSSIVFMLRYRGKSYKVELFKATLWGHGFFRNANRWRRDAEWLACRFRIRSNGKWFNDPEGPVALTRNEFRDLLWRTIPFNKILKDKS